MMNDFWTFVTANSGNIIISATVGFVFFVLGPIGLWFSKRKVRREKINRAQQQLLDLVEGMLVNKENFSENRLTSLFYAIERENQINLEIETDLENLFDDLILRFERSKHLSSGQKNEYIATIESLQKELFNDDEHEENRRDIPKSYKRIIDDLEENINNQKPEKALEGIEILRDKLTEPEKLLDKVFSTYSRIYNQSPATFIAIAATAISLYVFFIYSLFQ